MYMRYIMPSHVYIYISPVCKYSYIIYDLKFPYSKNLCKIIVPGTCKGVALFSSAGPEGTPAATCSVSNFLM